MHKLFGLKKAPSELHRAVASGEISAVRLLIQRGGELDQPDEDNKRTPLHIAAASGFDVIVGELLDRRAKTNIQDKDGNTPLHLACAGGHTRSVQLLLGSRNSDQSKHQPLQLRNAAGHTPLMVAAAAGHAAAVDLLIRAGADMHSAVLQGRVSVGHLAARGGHLQVLAVLASHGFDLTTDTLDMTSLLHEAAAHGHLAAVSWLLQAGVNPGGRNYDGKTALDLARAEQHHAVVQLLLRGATAAVPAAVAAGGPAGSLTTAAGGSGGGVGGGGGGVLLAGQQQKQQQQLAGLQVYPEDERYKFYPSVD